MLRTVPMSMELRIRRLEGISKMSEEIPKGVSLSRASLSGDFGANTYGQVPENAARRMTTLKPGENLMMETNS